MKNLKYLLLPLIFFFSSCSLVEGIFKAGAYTGIIIVVVIIVVIGIVISMFRKKS